MKRFRSAFIKTDFFNAASGSGTSVSCSPGVWTRIGYYKVLAGELVSVGYGMSNAQSDAEGRAYMTLRIGSGTASVTGMIRLVVESAQDMFLAPILEARLEALDQNSTDRTKQLPFPISMHRVSQDKKISLYFKVDDSYTAAQTITKADSTIMLDITRDLID